MSGLGSNGDETWQNVVVGVRCLNRSRDVVEARRAGVNTDGEFLVRISEAEFFRLQRPGVLSEVTVVGSGDSAVERLTPKVQHRGDEDAGEADFGLFSDRGNRRSQFTPDASRSLG
jgi:hypothetical protein